MTLKHLRITPELVPEGLLNHCEGLHRNFTETGTKYDINSLFLSLIHRENRDPGTSTISSPSMFLVEGVFRKSGVVRSFKVNDPVLLVFGSYVLYSRDL
jgi:hypothetical protein